MNISNVCLDQKLFNLSENDILIIGTDGTYLAGDQNIEKLTDISRYFDLSLFEEGVSLIKQADGILNDAQKKIKMLTEDEVK